MKPRVPGQFSRFLPVLLIGVLVLASHARLHADETTDTFLWEQANARLARAQQAADFLDAARCYNRLVQSGVRNGPLFANLGTALLLAGDGPNAVAALERAERYSGNTPDIRANLRLAQALQSGQREPDQPWERLLFFWHFDQPLRLRVVVALSCWTLLWLGILLRRIAARRGDGDPAPDQPNPVRTLGGSCIFFGALLALVFGTSALVSWVQESRDDQSWGERTFTFHEPQEAVR